MKKYIEIFDFQNLVNFKTGFFSIAGATVCDFLAGIYGGEVRLTVIGLLALTIALDWVGAIGAAIKDKTYASQYGILGVLRTAVIIALPAWANLFDNFMHTPGVAFYLLSTGLIYHTGISMTANFKRAGWDKWIGPTLTKLIESELQAKEQRSQDRKSDESGEPK